jgi:hypothetical protein
MSYSAAELEFLADAELVDALARVNAHPEKRRQRPSATLGRGSRRVAADAAVSRQAVAGSLGEHDEA